MLHYRTDTAYYTIRCDAYLAPLKPALRALVKLFTSHQQQLDWDRFRLAT